MVPLDVESCPECGYPFDDDFVKRCGTCGSLMVADLDTCPACGRLVEAESDKQPVRQPVAASESLSDVQPLQPQALRNDQENPLSSPAAVMPTAVESAATDIQITVLQATLHELITAVQDGGRRSDETARRLADAVASLKAELQEVSALVRAAREEHASVGVLEQISELKNEVATLLAQQQSGERQLLTAVNEAAARYTPVVLPASLRWLDYILIAVVVVMVFSIGNLLLMAYIAKLLMQE